MIYIHNSQTPQKQQQTTSTRNQLPKCLTQRGVRQAQRNQSDDIWSLMNWCSQQVSNAFVCNYCGVINCHICANNSNRRNVLSQNDATQKFQRSQNTTINFDETAKQYNRESGAGKQNDLSETRDQSNSLKKSNNRSKSKNVSFQDGIKQQQNKQFIKTSKPMTQQDIKKADKFYRECYSIQKYLESTKAYTRTMPNSAIRLFYQKPCLQSYGRKNTSGNNGFIYNDYLKSHNVQPHRHENDPKKYQTYRSALNFGKRMKLDPQERMKKIQRQFASKLDMKALVDDFSIGYIPVTSESLGETLKENMDRLKPSYYPVRKSKSTENLRNYEKSLNLSSTAATSIRPLSYMKQQDQQQKIENMKRKSKSFGKKQHLFLYRYENKDGDVQYCKDRHGITCYVDPSFEQNKDAYQKFLRKIKPIEAQDVAPEDRNIDKIMRANHLSSKQRDIPQHYLMPNCDQPYRPQKYSLKYRRKNSLATTSGLTTERNAVEN